MHDAEMFGIGRLLHAEGAADPAGQHAHLVAPDAEDRGEVVAEPEDALGADMERPMLALGVVLGDRGARLHRIDDDAVVAQLEPRHMGRFGKGGRDLLAVAIVEIEPDIPRHIVIEERRAGRGCFLGACDGRQRVDVDDHRFGGVLGLGNSFGDDRGDRVADIA